jgi:ribosomal protein L11 methyltransferase
VSTGLEADVPADEADLVSGVLWTAGVDAVQELDGGPGRILLRTALPDGDAADRLAVAVARCSPRTRCRTRPLVDDGWADAWRDHARAWAAGRRLWIQPTWLAPPGPEALAGRTVVHLDPGRAFGSGGHASTRLALAALDDVLGDGSDAAPTSGTGGTTVLDVGCGSGVLAIAALLLGASRARAVDIDPEAVRATAENAARNGVDDLLRVDGTDVARLEDSYGVVVANLLAPELRRLGPVLGARCAPDGRLVLAGLLEHQVDDVVAALGPDPDGRPRRELARHHDDGWVSLVLG